MDSPSWDGAGVPGIAMGSAQGVLSQDRGGKKQVPAGEEAGEGPEL